VRIAEGFILLLPMDRLEVVETLLRRYIMRADVTLTVVTNQWSLFGLVHQNSQLVRSHYAPELSQAPFAATTGDGWLAINLPIVDSERTLLMVHHDPLKTFWSVFESNPVIYCCDDEQWLLENIGSGIPEINAITAELFVPQMINLDQLGGVSFDKGCYTGQEVVARMRFLGKLKRRLYLAETVAATAPQPGDKISLNNHESAESVGTVVNVASISGTEPNHFKLLVVAVINAAEQGQLLLDSPSGEGLTLLPLPYHQDSTS